jgi:chromosome segregation ATPase
MENINTTSKVLSQKKEAIPDLRTALQEASARFAEATKAREQKDKENDLKKELAWAHVYQKEAEFTATTETLVAEQDRLPKAQEQLEQANVRPSILLGIMSHAIHSQAGLEAATQRVAEYEAEVKALGNMDHLDAQKQDLKGKIAANRKKIADYQVPFVHRFRSNY